MKNICQGAENIVALVGRRAQTMFATRAIRGLLVCSKHISGIHNIIDIGKLSVGIYAVKISGSFGINRKEKIIIIK
jgi:hypothetical protein